MKSKHCMQKLPLVVAAVAVALTCIPESQGVVVIRDGFGDADINNNNVAFESGDTINDYEPFLDANMNRVDSPLIFPAGTMILEPTAPDNSSDTGILWTASGGITNNGTGDPSARPRIIDDSAGHQPETVGGVGFFNSIAGATQHIPALDSGLALGFESKGRGRSITGFFEKDQSYAEVNGGNGKQGTIALGPNVDDTVKVSFDFRVWMSAPNYNTGDTNNHTPNRGELRFGIYNDADDELGQSNLAAGPIVDGEPNARIWGEEPGWFRGDRVFGDASGDPGWFVRLPLLDPDAEIDELFGPFPDGRTARINEETNSGDLDIHLQGQGTNNGGDVQTVAEPEEVSPNVFDFQNMETQKRYRLELSLRRFDETGGSTDPNTVGDNIEATVTVTNIDNASETWSLTGFDALDPEMLDPDAGFSSEAWDYFSIALAGSSSSDDFDFVMDNFTVEVIGSNAPGGIDVEPDGDVDGADFLAIQRDDPSLIPQWEAGFGGTGQAAVSGAVPEPSALVLLAIGGILAYGRQRR